MFKGFYKHSHFYQFYNIWFFLHRILAQLAAAASCTTDGATGCTFNNNMYISTKIMQFKTDGDVEVYEICLSFSFQ